MQIEIKPIGTYLEVDSEGYIVNPASLDKIQFKWKNAIDDVIELYKKHFDNKLHSVYLRGSVAKGYAVDSVSDLDTFAYVNLAKDEINTNWKNEARVVLSKKYPFIEGFEIDPVPVSYIVKDTIMLNQAVLVYGKEISIPKIKAGKDMILHATASRPGLMIYGVVENLAKETTSEGVKKRCVWFMKTILRIGSEITMERSKKYSRDLYICYEMFVEYYPEKESEMKKVLFLALNPTDDKDEIIQIVSGFGVWLIEESKRCLN